MLIADQAPQAFGGEAPQAFGREAPQAIGQEAPQAFGAGAPEAGAASTARADDSVRGPRFDAPVAQGGYSWWYVDALSDDGRNGITIIALIGSVFSPYYAEMRRRGGGDPLQHVSLNVAVYGEGKRWAMTERFGDAVQRDKSWLEIGPSSLEWDGDCLTIRIDEIAVPIPKRLRGTVRVHPTALHDKSYQLDSAGRHHWGPIAPCARVEVELEKPSVRWSGSGYLDSNRGDEPLEAAFKRWDWSRAALKRGAAVLYDVTGRDGAGPVLGLRFDPAGGVEPFEAPPFIKLPSTLWRVERGTRGDPQGGARVVETLEDTPFYARSVLETNLLGETATAMHESLCLDRFSARWVQRLLPFRIPRALR
ncbi:carotenoid 1,2-hydratase [Rhodoblastus sphagnicola]|nr:carotenoid 1,2-hydratase [Rhodoblastus sphagnicola]MBB4200309.1 carotenoid 1,2-hydratase [Rhodoblastus sphagnicola]